MAMAMAMAMAGEAMPEVAVEGTGLGALPDQIHADAAERGFEFNLMVAGETGLGKSTFVNALFAADLSTEQPYSPGDFRVSPSAEPVSRTFRLTESGVKLALTVIDTPGFGNAVDNTGIATPLVAELERRLQHFADGESRVDRTSPWPDQRVHCLLYFVAPTGHGLKRVDAEVLRAVHRLVNVVPVVGKSDLLTAAERQGFQARVLADLAVAGVTCFSFPADDDDDGGNGSGGGAQEGAAAAVKQPPFFVSAGPAADGGVRRYPWGAHDPKDAAHSDFALVRQQLVGAHMHTLIRATHVGKYEAFRVRSKGGASGDNGADGGEEGSRAGGGGSGSPGGAESPLNRFEKLEGARAAKLAAIEEDMKAAFDRTVADQEAELRQLESTLLGEHEGLQRELLVLKRSLEEKAAAFAREKEEAEAKPAPPPSSKKGKRLFK